MWPKINCQSYRESNRCVNPTSTAFICMPDACPLFAGEVKMINEMEAQLDALGTQMVALIDQAAERG